MAEVVLKQLSKHYGKTIAVDGIDLEIRDGELLVLVGPSGCGKTTTLRMIAGLEEITSGSVFIGQQEVNRVEPKDRNIAMVFQNYALYPHMNVYKNIGFGLRMRKTPRAEIDRRVREVAQTLGIQDLLERKPGQLSGGQRQRVALGRAIVREPAAFLFDEPLSNLDARLRVSMRTELVKLHQRLKTTTIYVTHDQTEAMTMGHRIVVMDGGKIQQVGTPQEIYQRPANRFVAEFIGSPPMNFVEMELRQESQALRLVRGNLKLTVPKRSGLDVGKKYSAGWRAEHIAFSPVPRVGAAIPGSVLVAQLLGAETMLTVETEVGELTVRAAAESQFQPGQKVTVMPSVQRMHLFDEEGRVV